ncbi:unnamed protein product [Nezara viridula]|uniref:Uncharacterized protein n=1 Tax=Nezara viridula TaxID=85310 RepID=A0A9P0HMU8_NEZVI|nr:unnamed protein product [Nezara viridula]
MRNPLPLFKSERTLCCVFGCNSRLNFKTNDVTLFHQLPFACNKEFLLKWVNAIKLPQKISKHMMVCSRHFKLEDYTRIDGVKELKPEAVPSENLPHVWRNKFHPRDYGRLIKILEFRGIGRLRLCFEAKLARQIRKAERKRKEKKLKGRINQQRVGVSEEKSNEQPQHLDHFPTIVRDSFTYDSSNPVTNQEHSLTSEIDIKEEPLSDNENEDTIHEEETVEEMLAKMNEEPADESQEQMLDNGNDKLGFENEESLWDSLLCNICGEEDCEGHEEDKFECAPCGKQFRTSRQLNAHNLSHFEYRRRGHPFDKEAICKVCNKVLSTKVSLNEHMLSHSNDKQYVCMLCDKPFRHKASLVMHINSHTIHPNHRCKMCGVCFSDAEELDRHVRKHKVLMREYTCRECGQQFRSKQACWAHLNSHMRARSKPGLSCDVCGRVLSTKATLKEHMFIHSGEKPFECQLCGRKIRHRANFIIHVQGHSLGQPHLCSLCGMGFAKKSELCSHTAAEHPEDRPFLCIICGMRFRTETRFFRHAISHDAQLEEV